MSQRRSREAAHPGEEAREEAEAVERAGERVRALNLGAETKRRENNR